MGYVNVSTEKELNDLGYVIQDEHREQIDIIFNSDSLKTQARINMETLGFCVGANNKLVAFVESKK